MYKIPEINQFELQSHISPLKAQNELTGTRKKLKLLDDQSDKDQFSEFLADQLQSEAKKDDPIIVGMENFQLRPQLALVKSSNENSTIPLMTTTMEGDHSQEGMNSLKWPKDILKLRTGLHKDPDAIQTQIYPEKFQGKEEIGINLKNKEEGISELLRKMPLKKINQSKDDEIATKQFKAEIANDDVQIEKILKEGIGKKGLVSKGTEVDGQAGVDKKIIHQRELLQGERRQLNESIFDNHEAVNENYKDTKKNFIRELIAKKHFEQSDHGKVAVSGENVESIIKAKRETKGGNSDITLSDKFVNFENSSIENAGKIKINGPEGAVSNDKLIELIEGHIISNMRLGQKQLSFGVKHSDFGPINVEVHGNSRDKVSIKIVTESAEGHNFFLEAKNELISKILNHGIYVNDFKLENSQKSTFQNQNESGSEGMKYHSNKEFSQQNDSRGQRREQAEKNEYYQYYFGNRGIV